MTREQTALLNHLKKDNKQARANGKAYLTDTKPLEAFCEKIPKDNAKEFLARYPALKAEMNADFEQLCWLLYFRCVSNTMQVNIDKKNPSRDFIDVPDTPQNKEFWALLTDILSNLNRMNGAFVEMSQNRVINSFPKTLSIGYQPEIGYENTATSIVTGKQRHQDIKYTLTNYWLNDNKTDALTPTVSALKLFRYFLLTFSSNHSQLADIPLREYASIIKDKAPEEISASALKDLKEQVVRDLDFLKNIYYDCQEMENRKWVHSGSISWNGGTALVKQGHIYWNWNTDFIPELERYAPAICNKAIFTAKLNTDEFFFYDLIDTNYRLNEDKPDQLNKIKIRRFLDVCVRIPKYENVKNREYKKQIIAPFHRIIDELKNIEIAIYNEDGVPRTTPDEWLNYEEFENGYVVVDYSDYPVNTVRIEHKRARAEKKRKKQREQ